MYGGLFYLSTDEKRTHFTSKVLLTQFNKAQNYKVPSINGCAAPNRDRKACMDCLEGQCDRKYH